MMHYLFFLLKNLESVHQFVRSRLGTDTELTQAQFASIVQSEKGEIDVVINFVGGNTTDHPDPSLDFVREHGGMFGELLADANQNEGFFAGEFHSLESEGKAKPFHIITSFTYVAAYTYNFAVPINGPELSQYTLLSGEAHFEQSDFMNAQDPETILTPLSDTVYTKRCPSSEPFGHAGQKRIDTLLHKLTPSRAL